MTFQCVTSPRLGVASTVVAIQTPMPLRHGVPIPSSFSCAAVGSMPFSNCRRSFLPLLIRQTLYGANFGHAGRGIWYVILRQRKRRPISFVYACHTFLIYLTGRGTE